MFIIGVKFLVIGYLGLVVVKWFLQEDCFFLVEVKVKIYIQIELFFKVKIFYEKIFYFFIEVCCELCGFYFENCKVLVSYVRVYLWQFGVIEWCVNGLFIEILSEWIKYWFQKVGVYCSYIQGGCFFIKKFCSVGYGCDSDKWLFLGLVFGGLVVVGCSVGGELGFEVGWVVDSGEWFLVVSLLGIVKVEEYQWQNINKFEC